MSQISLLYYRDNFSQKDIAEKFGLPKMTVSRILKKAKEEKVVDIDIKLPFLLNNKLASLMKTKYNLKDVFVVKINTKEEKELNISELLGQVWAFNFIFYINNNSILGVGVGKTLGYVAENLVLFKFKNIQVVQLMGGLSNVTDENPFTLVQNISVKLHAKGTYFTSYATVNNKELRDEILSNDFIGIKIKQLWEKCDLAIFGIGAIEKGTLLSPELIKPDELLKIKQSGGIGDILGHCFDINGNFINTSLEERLISIPIETFKKIKQRIAIAGGEDKFQSIKGALNSGIVTTLVIDENTAKKILEKP
jgi:DNA-binding transcriptional regulator LsrR (DeoR family)